MFATTASLLLGSSGCDRRVFELDADGIGDEIGDSETETDDDTETSDAAETETGGSTTCTESVTELTITDATDPATVECVTKVLGDLVIGPSIGLIDLGMLAELREVGGSLSIVGNLGLTSLAGADQLREVGWLHVRRNGALVDLGGLEGLTKADRISVINNDALTSLAGLSPGLGPSELDIAGNDILPDLDGLPAFNASSASPLDIEIEDHQSLTNLAGLAACCSTQPVIIEIARNAALLDLDGLEPFQRFDTLRLVDNRMLEDLSGIDATEIGILELSYNQCSGDPDPVLVDFTGLEQTLSIDVLQVEWVASLESFAGLESMVDVTTLAVNNNAKLDWQHVLDLAGQTGPTIFEACGGIGGPECPTEICPNL